MKLANVTFLFFIVSSLLLSTSCTQKEELKFSKNSEQDSIPIFIQNMKNNDLDFKTRLNQANRAFEKIIIKKEDSRIEGILAYKIYLFGNLKQYDSAIYISKELLRKSIKDNDSISIGGNYSRIAYYNSRNQQNDSAYYYYNLLKNGFFKYNDSITNGNNLLDMAIIERSFGDYNSSEYTGTLALKYFGDKNPNSSASVYNMWAISSKTQGQMEEALQFYKKAISLSTSKKNIIIYKNNLAITYRDLKEYDKSIAILDSLNKIETLDMITKARIIDNLAYIKWLVNKNENILPNLQNALAIRLEEDDFYGSIASYAHLSKYFENLNPKVALSYASKMYYVATNQKSAQDQLEALQKLISLDNSEKVKEYYSTYISLNDSLQKSKELSQHKFAKIRYESDKNQKENLQLKVAQSTSKLELEREKNRNIIGVVSSSSVVLGLLVFGYYKKQKHTLEKRAEVYNTEKRIAKKIHDEVANNVVNIMNKIQYTEEPKEELLNYLEKVYLFTRNISHENNAIVTGEKYEEFLKAMLTNFNNDSTTIIIKDISKVGIAEIAKEKQIELYRILQELMVNMQKHSKASLVAITFKNKKITFISIILTMVLD